MTSQPWAEREAMAVRLFKRATSLGGVESLIEHRQSTEGASSPIPDDLLRLSIGLKTPDDLVSDLMAALEPIARAFAMRLPFDAAPTAHDLAGSVARVIEHDVAPLIIARGGELRVASISEGVVTLEASGSPGAVAPVIASIGSLVRWRVPGVTDVRVVWSADGASEPTLAALLERIQHVLDADVNPAVAARGGHITLVGVEDGRERIELHGGCQGCSLADVTVRQGVERLIRTAVPEIVGVVDVTDHGAGAAPYFAPGKR